MNGFVFYSETLNVLIIAWNMRVHQWTEWDLHDMNEAQDKYGRDKDPVYFVDDWERIGEF